jgi:hypothetical protein
MKDKNGKNLIINMSVDVVGIDNDRFIVVGFDNDCGDVHLCSVRCGSSIWRHRKNVVVA